MNTAPSPVEVPDDLHAVQVSETTFEDYLDTFVETQTAGLELEPAKPHPLAPKRRQVERSF